MASVLTIVPLAALLSGALPGVGAYPASSGEGAVPCPRADGSTGYFEPAGTAGTVGLTMFWFQEVATPQTLVNPNYLYEVHVGWQHNLEGQHKTVDVGVYEDLQGNPYSNTYSATNEWRYRGIRDRGDPMGTSLDCGELIIPGVKYGETQALTAYGGAGATSYTKGEGTEERITQETQTRSTHSWGVKATCVQAGSGAACTGTGDYKGSLEKTETNTQELGESSWIQWNSVFDTASGPLVQIGGGSGIILGLPGVDPQ